MPVVVAAIWLLLRRRARAAGASQGQRPTARRRLRHRGWLPGLAASAGAAGVMAVAVLGCCVTDVGRLLALDATGSLSLTALDTAATATRTRTATVG